MFAKQVTRVSYSGTNVLFSGLFIVSLVLKGLRSQKNNMKQNCGFLEPKNADQTIMGVFYFVLFQKLEIDNSLFVQGCVLMIFIMLVGLQVKWVFVEMIKFSFLVFRLLKIKVGKGTEKVA